jgi:hypothetical protein
MRHAKIENGGGPIFTWRKGVRFLFFRELFPLYIYIYIWTHTHTHQLCNNPIFWISQKKIECYFISIFNHKKN